jgi:hypothetical protein
MDGDGVSEGGGVDVAEGEREGGGVPDDVGVLDVDAVTDDVGDLDVEGVTDDVGVLEEDGVSEGDGVTDAEGLDPTDRVAVQLRDAVTDGDGVGDTHPDVSVGFTTWYRRPVRVAARGRGAVRRTPGPLPATPTRTSYCTDGAKAPTKSGRHEGPPAATTSVNTRVPVTVSCTAREAPS